MRWTTGVTMLVLATLAAVPAQAQRRRAEATPDEARRLFFDGAQLFEEGDYEGALSSWQASYAARPEPVVQYNMALALRELFRYAEAVELLRAYLASASSIAPRRRESVEGAIAMLEDRIAPITLVVEPAGARIRVDGRDVGVAPLAGPLLLGAGRRRLEVEADGYVTVSDEISVAGRMPRELTVRLAPRNEAGRLRLVASEPAGAELRIDGLDVGQAPTERELPRGGHVIEARAPGFQLYRASIELADRQELDLRVRLEPLRETTLADEWWFWSIVGAVAIGTAVTIAIVTQPTEPPPIPGNGFQGVIEVLRER